MLIIRVRLFFFVVCVCVCVQMSLCTITPRSICMWPTLAATALRDPYALLSFSSYLFLFPFFVEFFLFDLIMLFVYAFCCCCFGAVWFADCLFFVCCCLDVCSSTRTTVRLSAWTWPRRGRSRRRSCNFPMHLQQKKNWG